MTKEEMIRDEDLYLGLCRGCGHPLEAPEAEIHNGPRDEIFLQCTILDTQDCVAGEWFKISDFL
jgi:hypothetical protein